MWTLFKVLILALFLAGTASAQVVTSGGGNASGFGLPPTNGLIGWYQINDGLSQLTDSSGNGNTGTFCASAPTWLTNNTGLLFNGSSNCVVLPAVFNSTAKAFIIYTENIPNANFNCFIAGNSSGNSISWYTTNQSESGIGQGLPFLNARVSSFDPAGAGSSASLTFDGGFGVMSWLFDTTDRFLLGTSEPTDPTGGYYGRFRSSFNLQSAGNIQLGGSSNGRNSNACWFNGQIHYMLVYNRVPTNAEIGAINQFISNVMTSRNLAPSYVNTTYRQTTDEVVFVGDSITQGVNGATPFMTNIVLIGGTMDIQNQGRTGKTLLNMNLDMANSATPLMRPLAARNVAMIWGGTNDGQTLNPALSNYSQACFKAHAIGMKCLITTMIDRTGETTWKNTLNLGLMQNWTTLNADGFVDMASDPAMGADGANTGTCFQVDHTHGTSGCNINHMGPIAQRAINRLYGNLNFSAANVYGSAAAAATATTAGSESGNTITITFGATPANCQAGSTVTLAGITPAGYNGVYQIITRSATQITLFSDTTGLGAVTVQGTGVCPQQVDADVYTILNFGAGNFTLESCQGYTGQNLYIKNINAGGSTIVPFGTETIDGAANLAIAQNVTRILQSQLISQAAGGCTWKVMQ